MVTQSELEKIQAEWKNKSRAERLNLLLEYARKVPPYPIHEQKDEYLVPGCLVPLYVKKSTKGLWQVGCSSQMMLGVAWIFIHWSDAHPGEEIPPFLQNLLSHSRRNALFHLQMFLQKI